MSKFSSFLLAGVLASGLVVGCSASESAQTDESAEAKAGATFGDPNDDETASHRPAPLSCVDVGVDGPVFHCPVACRDWGFETGRVIDGACNCCSRPAAPEPKPAGRQCEAMGRVFSCQTACRHSKHPTPEIEPGGDCYCCE